MYYEFIVFQYNEIFAPSLLANMIISHKHEIVNTKRLIFVRF